jgi:hypothetical protein
MPAGSQFRSLAAEEAGAALQDLQVPACVLWDQVAYHCCPFPNFAPHCLCCSTFVCRHWQGPGDKVRHDFHGPKKPFKRVMNSTLIQRS